MNLRDEILNQALLLSMEWGENWLQPVNDRLSKIYPELSHRELTWCNSLCTEVNKEAHRFVYENPVFNGPDTGFVDVEIFSTQVLKKFGWIDKENLQRLYSQSCYYARK
ncbi:hypothetical protein LQ567_15435 [Niabella pedocola]|uniref:Uncharacterized protein n=1 Tax=Niabella pedocola TaxID=1752077 RepID=A0ABS8PV80_9BACT|nr:hypothetical protein [Niabella pedocola]MCD2424172.1 hypothetical protein [Niabella pedocola]